MMKNVRTLLPLMVLALVGCSSTPDTPKQTKDLSAPLGAITASNKKHPLAKYIEIAGFRLEEGKPGHLKIHFGVINHSDADISELDLKVTMATTADKPGDEPIAVVDVKVPGLGPQENKDVTIEAPTKKRVYELPDWQFLRASFEITSPM